MKVSTENGELILEEVYNGITLITNDKEKLSICMRDSGFEFTYMGQKFSAQEGVISPVGEAPQRQLCTPETCRHGY